LYLFGELFIIVPDFMDQNRVSDDRERVVISNRKARHDYHILETLECGIVLTGTEVKSIRNGKANLLDSYAFIREGEVFLEGMHISPYEFGNQFNHDPKRQRKLLLKRKEIRKLIGRTSEKGLTLIPLRIYLLRGRVKVELAIAKGKKSFDKRASIAERDAKRDADREVRTRLKM
jgi:SsrA-binding protein